MELIIVFGAVALIIFIVIICAVLCGILLSKVNFPSFIIEPAHKRAGNRGEKFATQIINEILNEKDVLLTNVNISYDGKRTELDNVIINRRGVFIIEVKNYSGELYGAEDDYEWIKNKITNSGNIYSSKVRNPISQVKRQVYILSNYLKQYGVSVWVEGYVFLIEMNSPVDSDYILTTQVDINNAIHCGRNNNLTSKTTDKIVDLLSPGDVDGGSKYTR